MTNYRLFSLFLSMLSMSAFAEMPSVAVYRFGDTNARYFLKVGAKIFRMADGCNDGSTLAIKALGGLPAATPVIALDLEPAEAFRDFSYNETKPMDCTGTQNYLPSGRGEYFRDLSQRVLFSPADRDSGKVYVVPERCTNLVLALWGPDALSEFQIGSLPSPSAAHVMLDCGDQQGPPPSVARSELVWRLNYYDSTIQPELAEHVAVLDLCATDNHGALLNGCQFPKARFPVYSARKGSAVITGITNLLEHLQTRFGIDAPPQPLRSNPEILFDLCLDDTPCTGIRHLDAKQVMAAIQAGRIFSTEALAPEWILPLSTAETLHQGWQAITFWPILQSAYTIPDCSTVNYWILLGLQRPSRPTHSDPFFYQKPYDVWVAELRSSLAAPLPYKDENAVALPCIKASTCTVHLKEDSQNLLDTLFSGTGSALSHCRHGDALEVVIQGQVPLRESPLAISGAAINGRFRSVTIRGELGAELMNQMACSDPPSVNASLWCKSEFIEGVKVGFAPQLFNTSHYTQALSPALYLSGIRVPVILSNLILHTDNALAERTAGIYIKGPATGFPEVIMNNVRVSTEAPRWALISDRATLRIRGASLNATFGGLYLKGGHLIVDQVAGDKAFISNARFGLQLVDGARALIRWGSGERSIGIKPTALQDWAVFVSESSQLTLIGGRLHALGGVTGKGFAVAFRENAAVIAASKPQLTLETVFSDRFYKTFLFKGHARYQVEIMPELILPVGAAVTFECLGISGCESAVHTLH